MTDTNSKPEWARGARDKMNAARVEAGLKPKPRTLLWAILGITGVAAIGFALASPAPEVVPAPDAQPLIVKQIRQAETTVISPATLRQTVKVTGTLEPAKQAEVASQVSAPVLKVLVRPGDKVEKGHILVELDREVLNIELSQARSTAEATRAQLVSAEQQLQRTKELANQRLATPSALEQAQSTADALRSNLAALEEAVKAAELSLANAALRAPISGVVSLRSIEAGQSVAAGTSVITIVDLDTMEYQASASVSASALVRQGQEVMLAVTGLEGTFTGTVARVNPVAISGTRTISIYITVDNAGQVLRGGMFATGAIVVDEKEGAIAVPAEALREDSRGNYLLGLESGVVVRQPVQPGASWNFGQSVEVSGVDMGDHIVTTPLTRLSAGDRYSLSKD